MDEVIGNLLDPHFGFPCYFHQVIFEFPEIGKCADIDACCLDICQKPLKLEMPLGRDRPMRCDGFDQKEPFRIRLIQDNVRQLPYSFIAANPAQAEA